MNNLYLINNLYLQEYTVDYLDLFSILSVLCAIFVIVNNNPIVSILFLICLFVLVSGYLIFLGMNFLGITYLLVYIGAISILFLFILMLINIRISEIQNETNNSLPLTAIISILFIIALDDLLPSSLIKNILNLENKKSILEYIGYSDNNINFISSDQWDTNLVEILHITSIGNVLYTNYFFWLILASVILLLAMVGAIIITLKE